MIANRTNEQKVNRWCKSGSPRRAQRYCARLVRNNKNDVELALLLTGCLEDQQLLRKSRRYLLPLYRKNLRESSLLYYYGRYYMRRGWHSSALRMFDRALKIGSFACEVYYTGHVYYYRGNVLRRLNRLQEAVWSYLLDIETHAGFSAYSYNNLALTLNDLGRYREAQKYLLSLLHRDDADVDAPVNLNISLRQDRPRKRSVRIYEALLKEYPSNSILWYGFSRLLEDKDDLNAALSAIENAIKFDATKAKCWLQKYFIASALELTKVATIAITKAYQLDPKDDIIRYNYARWLSIIGRKAKAIRVFKPLVGPDSADGVAMNIVAWCYYNLGRKREALLMFDRSRNAGYTIHPPADLRKGLKTMIQLKQPSEPNSTNA